VRPQKKHNLLRRFASAEVKWAISSRILQLYILHIFYITYAILIHYYLILHLFTGTVFWCLPTIPVIRRKMFVSDHAYNCKTTNRNIYDIITIKK